MIGFQGPSDGEGRATDFLGGGTADVSAWRTIRRCTPNRRDSSRMDGPSASALALRISSNSSTFDLVRMGPRLQPTVERPVDPYLAASRMGPEQMVTVGPVQVITPSARHDQRGVPLVRGVQRLSRILDADEVELLMSSFRTDRDRAMAQAMLLGGLRRCEVLGLRLEDLRVGERQLFIAEGKGGHQRLVPIFPTFFATVADYLNRERPPDAPTDRLFVALKGPQRGAPLSAEGLDEVFGAARARVGLVHGTCHEDRHTCFTRLKEAGMAIEAIQALAGHRSIASTRIYLHLGGDWLATEYRRAAEAIDAQANVGVAR